MSVCTELIKKSFENGEKGVDNALKSLFEATQIEKKKIDQELRQSKNFHENVSISETYF